jgi:peptidoglycan/xylan/chitin deacetylase (PgdA/CDA1 family)
MNRVLSILGLCGLLLATAMPASAFDVGPTTTRSVDGRLLPSSPEPDVPIEPRPGRVALTFDDGPSPVWTPLVLDILREYDVTATFFVIGWRVEQHPDIVRRMVAEGHSVQNHSWSHLWLTRYSTATVVEQLERGSEIIEAVTGQEPNCIRPPFGAHDARIRSIFRDLGLHSIMWHRDPQEWRGSVNSVTSYLVRHTRDQEIVLMHDTNGYVIARALPGIIEGIRAKGLGFDTICDPLLQWDPPAERLSDVSHDRDTAL